MTWADGTPAPVGGRLGGYIGADRVVMRPAIAEFDAVAAKIAEAVNTAQQTGATSSGTPGAPVLRGDSALTLRVAEGVTAADIAAGAPGPSSRPTPRRRAEPCSSRPR
ncbi:hypothetical protein GCM10025883_27140 [Mobilicoccus caccae]|uniref:Flagellar hook-associated protein FlgK helical domain-containing protein n=1 Tax=Mobilicoccus caccae TaxID=1859295 RepID=A0ABQ6IT62_9MICO|nr:hypothetical protein GCM10025883_27140 [Mobilicoccus caccae]